MQIGFIGKLELVYDEVIPSRPAVSLRGTMTESHFGTTPTSKAISGADCEAAAWRRVADCSSSGQMSLPDANVHDSLQLHIVDHCLGRNLSPRLRHQAHQPAVCVCLRVIEVGVWRGGGAAQKSQNNDFSWLMEVRGYLKNLH